MNEIELFTRTAADMRHIDVDTVVRVFGREGGVDKPSVVGKFATGWSFWPPQLHYGGTDEWGQDFTRFGTTAGLGNSFTHLTQWQPGDLAAWRDAVRYGLNWVRKVGWSWWYAAQEQGIGKWDGISRDAEWNPSAEVWDFERRAAPNGLTAITALNVRDAPGLDTNIIGALPKDIVARSAGATTVDADNRVWLCLSSPVAGWVSIKYLEPVVSQPQADRAKLMLLDVPLTVQQHDWDCAQESVWRVLKQLGRNPSNAWMEQDMLAKGIESTEVGLTDASGRLLAQWVNDTYGDDLHAEAHPSIDFATAARLAGTVGLVAGARNWGGPGHGHWTAIDGYADGVLDLGNPGGSGPLYGQQSLNQDGWDARGPWSAVTIEKR